MKVPFVDWAAAYKGQSKELNAAFKRINVTAQLLLRQDVEDFEASLAKITGTQFAVGMNSCSDALYLALVAAGVGRDDEVITVSHTFVATIQAIERIGAKPVFVDVDLDELMDVTQIEAKITPKTKAIIPVHLTGKVVDMDVVMEIAGRHNLIVIEDAAQAFGATYKGRPAGSLGHMACFSFYPFKILGCPGDGGAVTTNSAEYARLLRLFRNHGNVSQTGMDVGESAEVRKGINSRLDNLQAAILNIRLKNINVMWMRREMIAMMYDDGLAGLPITLPTRQEGRVYQEYVIQVDNRQEFTKYLNDNGIDLLPNIKQQTIGLKSNHKMWCDDFLPNTEHFTEKNVRLPIWPTLKDAQIKYVIKTIHAYFKKQQP